MLKSVVIVAVSALFATVLVPTTASANVTYFYGGKINPTNSRDGGIVSYVDLHAPMTFEFTVASALGANLAGLNIAPSVLSWTASAGKPTSTVTSTDAHPFLRFYATTNGAGNLTAWNIVASATNTVLPSPPGYDEQFLFEQNTFGSDTTVRFIERAFGQSIGGAVCGSTCGQGNGFVVEASAGGVPEPASWAMMLVGFGGLGAVLRRRRCQVASAT